MKSQYYRRRHCHRCCRYRGLNSRLPPPPHATVTSAAAIVAAAIVTAAITAAAIAAAGIFVYVWKGETEEEFLWCIEQTILHNGKPWDANMILDDGGDLTGMVHDKYPEMLDKIHGISEETTTGVHRLLEMIESGELKVPAINVNDAVTKAKNDNKYGCRHSLNDAIKRGTDMLMSGKKALLIGYGDVGKGSAMSLRQEGMIVKISEIDPICALQAAMDGFEIMPISKAAEVGDIFITVTGNAHVIIGEHFSKMKSGAMVCNSGHFDVELELPALKAQSTAVVSEVRPNVD